jgi:hypothetical protein
MADEKSLYFVHPRYRHRYGIIANRFHSDSQICASSHKWDLGCLYSRFSDVTPNKMMIPLNPPELVIYTPLWEEINLNLQDIWLKGFEYELTLCRLVWSDEAFERLRTTWPITIFIMVLRPKGLLEEFERLACDIVAEILNMVNNDPNNP